MIQGKKKVGIYSCLLMSFLPCFPLFTPPPPLPFGPNYPTLETLRLCTWEWEWYWKDVGKRVSRWSSTWAEQVFLKIKLTKLKFFFFSSGLHKHVNWANTCDILVTCITGTKRTKPNLTNKIQSWAMASYLFNTGQHAETRLKYAMVCIHICMYVCMYVHHTFVCNTYVCTYVRTYIDASSGSVHVYFQEQPFFTFFFFFSFPAG